MRTALHWSLGALFGFVLSRNGAADFDTMTEMFLFRDFHLYGVALVTTFSSMATLAILQRHNRNIRWSSRPIHRGTVWGAVLFGIGWGISGACPGTALVQLGEGHLVAGYTVVGIVAGTAIYPRVNRRFLKWPHVDCS